MLDPTEGVETVEPAAYIAACLPHALAEQAMYGVPASVSLAQGALESG